MSGTGKRIKVSIMVTNLMMGGAEHFCIELARALDRDRFDVTLVSMWSKRWLCDSYREAIDTLHVPIVYLDLEPKTPHKGEKILLYFRRLAAVHRYVRRERPDVLHANMSAVPYCAAAGFFLKTPLMVQTVHGMFLQKAGLCKRIEYFLYRKTRLVTVTIASSMRAELAAFLRRPEESFALLHNGADLARFYPQQRAREGGARRFLFVGRLESIKNPMLALDAFLAAHGKNPHISLTFLGDGSLRGALEKRALESGAEGCVSFAGAVSDVPERMRAADALIVSSDSEGLPLAVIEGMACGLPVAATRCGGIVDVVRDGEEGFLVPLGDREALTEKMLELAGSEELLRGMSVRAAERAREFSVEKMAEQYGKLYERARNRRKVR